MLFLATNCRTTDGVIILRIYFTRDKLVRVNEKIDKQAGRQAGREIGFI
jgi:hypothetical protein